MGLFLCLLEIFAKCLDFLLQSVLLRGDLSRVELLVEGPQLVILDRCDSPEGLLYNLLHLLLLQKLLDSNGASDGALIGPRLEGNHLVIGPVMELYLDFGGFLFPVGVRRLHLWNRGSIHNVPPFVLQILESLWQVLCARAHDWYKKRSCIQKKLLEKTLGNRFLHPT